MRLIFYLNFTGKLAWISLITPYICISNQNLKF
jgi:hypothetical protein